MTEFAHKMLDQVGIIPLHFDVPNHSLPLNQFVKSAQSLQEIIDDFNKEFFDDDLKYEIHVVSPQKGGLLELIQLVLDSDLLLAATGAWAFLCSDIGRKYIKGLTGQEPSEFAEKLGEKHKKLFNNKQDEEKLNKDDESKNKLLSVLIALIIAQMVIGFLESKPDKLQKLGLSKKKHRDAFEAKNNIIQSCIKNHDVNGLGFDDSHTFPIRRKDFPKHIVELPPLEEDEIDFSWIVEIADIKVYSPNWKRMGKRLWQGDTLKSKDISFSIEDDVFWGHVDVKDIQPAINDNMKVQWAYPVSPNKKPSNVKVLKVITYNGTPISDMLVDRELAEALGDYSHAPPDLQQDLFETIPTIKSDKTEALQITEYTKNDKTGNK